MPIDQVTDVPGRVVFHGDFTALAAPTGKVIDLKAVAGPEFEVIPSDTILVQNRAAPGGPELRIHMDARDLNKPGPFVDPLSGLALAVAVNKFSVSGTPGTVFHVTVIRAI